MGAIQFQSVETLHVKRSMFDLSYEHNTTGDMGMMIPIMVKEAIPSDIWKMGNRMIIRMAPMVAPIFHPINAKTMSFFVPNRIIYPKPNDPVELSDIDHNWENYITGGEDGEDDTVIPLWNAEDKTSPHTIWDFMGMPRVTNTLNSESLPNKLALRAYNMIYNEYFRDQNLQEPADLDEETLKYACWEKDYFTSSLPFQQRGTMPAIPLSGIGGAIFGDGGIPTFIQSSVGQGAPFSGTGNPSQIWYNIATNSTIPRNPNEFGIFKGQTETAAGQPASQPSLYNNVSRVYNYNNQWGQTMGIISPSGNISQEFSTAGLIINQDLVSWLNKNTIDFDTAGGIDIATMRLAFQTQKWLERNARAGSRYTEQLKARFNETAGDARLDRPEFLGGTKTPIVISEVLQTAQNPTSVGRQPSSQLGTMAGHGLTADINHIGTYKVKEHGWIITILVIRPDTSYAQGLDLQYSRRSRYDYLTPEFVNLSERAVMNRELFCGSDESYNSTIFGYQGMYNEYRYAKNLSTGLMQTDFNFWNLTRLFNPASPPSLNSDFVTCKPDKRIFSVPSEPGFFISYGAINDVLRPLPIFPEPGLIDHH